MSTEPLLNKNKNNSNASSPPRRPVSGKNNTNNNNNNNTSINDDTDNDNEYDGNDYNDDDVSNSQQQQSNNNNNRAGGGSNLGINDSNVAGSVLHNVHAKNIDARTQHLHQHTNEDALRKLDENAGVLHHTCVRISTGQPIVTDAPTNHELYDAQYNGQNVILKRFNGIDDQALVAQAKILRKLSNNCDNINKCKGILALPRHYSDFPTLSGARFFVSEKQPYTLKTVLENLKKRNNKRIDSQRIELSAGLLKGLSFSHVNTPAYFVGEVNVATLLVGTRNDIKLSDFVCSPNENDSSSATAAAAASVDLVAKKHKYSYHWRSPENFQDPDKGMSVEADCYVVALLLFTLWRNDSIEHGKLKNPWDNLSEDEVYDRVVKRQERPANSVQELMTKHEIPEIISHIIVAGWQQDASARSSFLGSARHLFHTYGVEMLRQDILPKKKFPKWLLLASSSVPRKFSPPSSVSGLLLGAAASTSTSTPSSSSTQQPATTKPATTTSGTIYEGGDYSYLNDLDIEDDCKKTLRKHKITLRFLYDEEMTRETLFSLGILYTDCKEIVQWIEGKRVEFQQEIDSFFDRAVAGHQSLLDQYVVTAPEFPTNITVADALSTVKHISRRVRKIDWKTAFDRETKTLDLITLVWVIDVRFTLAWLFKFIDNPDFAAEWCDTVNEIIDKDTVNKDLFMKPEFQKYLVLIAVECQSARAVVSWCRCIKQVASSHSDILAALLKVELLVDLSRFVVTPDSVSSFCDVLDTLSDDSRNKSQFCDEKVRDAFASLGKFARTTASVISWCSVVQSVTKIVAGNDDAKELYGHEYIRNCFVSVSRYLRSNLAVESYFGAILTIITTVGDRAKAVYGIATVRDAFIVAAKYAFSAAAIRSWVLTVHNIFRRNNVTDAIQVKRLFGASNQFHEVLMVLDIRLKKHFAPSAFNDSSVKLKALQVAIGDHSTPFGWKLIEERTFAFPGLQQLHQHQELQKIVARESSTELEDRSRRITEITAEKNGLFDVAFAEKRKIFNNYTDSRPLLNSSHIVAQIRNLEDLIKVKYPDSVKHALQVRQTMNYLSLHISGDESAGEFFRVVRVLCKDGSVKIKNVFACESIVNRFLFLLKFIKSFDSASNWLAAICNITDIANEKVVPGVKLFAIPPIAECFVALSKIISGSAAGINYWARSAYNVSRLENGAAFSASSSFETAALQLKNIVEELPSSANDVDEAKDYLIKILDLDVVWQEDSESSSCMKCKNMFFLWNRRHHCRHCLRIFCDDCSRKTLTSKITPKTIVRVCDACFRRAQITTGVL